jgi:hypothetical protein
MSRITDSAAGEACALRLPGVCNCDPTTTVWAHWNELDGGKAKGKKLARFDHLGAYACYACHMVLDGQAKRPAWLTLEAVKEAMRRAVRECEAKLKEKGLWPSAEFLAAKPVTVQRIVKVVRTPEQRAARQKDKSREPVRAGLAALPSSKKNGIHSVGSARSTSKRIVSGTVTKENAKSRFPKGRKLVSANRLQSRPFGVK